MLQHMLELSFFLSLMDDIPLHVYTTFCLSIHLSLDMWADHTFGWNQYCCVNGSTHTSV
jgi:hypothetical protein